jgi:hypothetical protein
MNWLDELGALRPEHRLIFNDFYTNEELQCSILLSGVTFAPHKCKAVVSVRVGVAAAALVDLFERHYGNRPSCCWSACYSLNAISLGARYIWP